MNTGYTSTVALFSNTLFTHKYLEAAQYNCRRGAEEYGLSALHKGTPVARIKLNWVLPVLLFPPEDSSRSEQGALLDLFLCGLLFRRATRSYIRLYIDLNFEQKVWMANTHFPTTELTWVRISPTYWSICAWKQKESDGCKYQTTFRELYSSRRSYSYLMFLVDHRHAEHGDHRCRGVERAMVNSDTSAGPRAQLGSQHLSKVNWKSQRIMYTLDSEVNISTA